MRRLGEIRRSSTDADIFTTLTKNFLKCVFREKFNDLMGLPYMQRILLEKRLAYRHLLEGVFYFLRLYFWMR